MINVIFTKTLTIFYSNEIFIIVSEWNDVSWTKFPQLKMIFLY